MPATIGSIITGLSFAATGSTFAAGVAYGAATWTIAGTAISTAQVLGTIALTGASIALKPSPPSLGVSKVSLRNPIGFRTRSYGRVRLSGELAELKVSYILNEDGDGVLFNATMFMTGEIDAYEKFYVHDQEVRIDSLGRATYPGVFNDNFRVSLYTHLGAASQTVDSNLAAAFPARWSAKHRLDGIAYIVGRYNGVPLNDFSTVYSFGIPSVSSVFRAAKVWDPRIAAQSADNPATWAWTTNGPLIVMDFLWHDDGMRLPRSMIVSGIDTWIEQANKADEAAALISGGTEARYQLSSSYALTDAPKDVLKKMLTPMDAWVRLREDSAVVLEVGEFVTPTEHETFGVEDIIGFALKRGAPKLDIKNEIRATYTSPGHNFQPQEADPYQDAASIALDGLKTGTLDLSWCFSHRQARLRQKVELARQNPEWLGQVVLNPRGFNLLGKRYLKLTIPFLGIDTSFYLTEPAKIDMMAGTVTCDVVSFPASAYELSLAEQGVSPENETPGNHGVPVPVGATSVTITCDGAGGGGSGNDGAGGGARCIKTIAVAGGDVGKIITFTNGAGGRGDPQDLALCTDGGASTVTGSLIAGSIAMSAGGGTSGINGHAGGTASGGDTNTSGSGASGGDGGNGASGATENEAPGGGGHEGVDGGHGKVIFDWTIS